MVIAPLVWIVLAQVPTTPLSGTVVGPGGEPVAGAEVILVGLPSYAPPILARVKSGEGGRFTLDRPSSLVGDHHRQRAPILWVVKPGFRAWTTRFPEALPKADEPVKVVLEPPGRAEVRVEGPEGEPVAGARVLMERLRSDFTLVPDAIAEMTAATTDAGGLAVLDAVTQDELAYADVHSAKFGIQGRFLGPSPEKPRRIALRAVSNVKGRLSAEDPKFIKGWKVRAWTRTGSDPKAEPETTGYVETSTDDEGRFVLSPIAVGGLQLELTPPGDLPVVADIPRGPVVREGRDQTLEIPLRAPATVTGLVLERGTGRPVPGVQATMIYIGTTRHGGDNVTTDDKGRYTFRALPGEVRIGHFIYPKTYVEVPVRQNWQDFTVPPGPKLIELATREAIPAAPPLRVRVVDETGRPVPGASAEAVWSFTLGGLTGGGGRYSERADERGEFIIEGLGPGSDVAITARAGGRRNETPAKALAGQEGPATVAIVPMPTVAVAGRLVGPGGVPVAGVPVKVQVRFEQNNRPGFPEQPRFEGNPAIVTAADGTFRTPQELDRKPSEYRVEVEAPGYLPARTGWVPLGESDVVTLPDLALRRSRRFRVVSGRVVDREGRPLPHASVMQAGDAPSWSSTRTDGSGRFVLRGFVEGEALVFAEAPGFRFGGAVAGPATEGVEIRLGVEDEPPLSIPRALRSPLTRPEERALGRELLAPVLPQARAGSLGIEGRRVLPALARVDPSRVLSMIESRAVEPAGLLAPVALWLFEDDPAGAIAAIEDDLDPASRAACWLALEGFRPPADRPTREKLLDRALIDARQAANSETRLRLLGQVADRWLDLGAFDRAAPILREGRAIVETLPKDKWSQEAEQFAEVLAAIDLPAARDLFTRKGKTNVSRADENTIRRHEAEAALRLAAIDPAGAEKLLPGPSPNLYDRDGFALRVARRMARVDPDRARRVLDTLNIPGRTDIFRRPALAHFGLGLMAGELAGTDPDRARKLLDEAFAGLRTMATSQPGAAGANYASASVWMARLLPVVGRIDPDRLAERIWLAAASRGPTTAEPKAQEVQEAVVLAMLLARFDREIASTVIAGTLERLPDLIADPASSSDNNANATTFRALAAYDPRAVVALIRSLPEWARKPPPRHDTWTAASVESRIRIAAAEMLGIPAGARPDEAIRGGNYPWPNLRGD